MWISISGFPLAVFLSIYGVLADTVSPINKLPIFYDTSDIHLVNASHGLDSFWGSSFIRTTNNHAFLISANIITNNGTATQRAGFHSVDDSLSDTALTRNFQAAVLAAGSDGTAEPFNITTQDGRFAMESIPTSNCDSAEAGAQAFPPMHIFSSIQDISFDIDIYMQGPVILNAGIGSFQWGGSIQHHISLSAARPSGTITVNNEILTIDSESSFTWYDRQWGPTLPDHLTWFGLYVTAPDNTRSYLSVWNWQDSINGDKSFVTIQEENGSRNIVVPVMAFDPSDTLLFTSSVTGLVYPLEYNVTLEDGTEFRVRSLRPIKSM
ncbi:hypothetical protein BDW74DRAFT_182189 [Aspergillus multicolor]|uniref:uncharacterized protein n=1 Tax=Aspergillus multicolor TaxID=41759 RepID=UPI003CCD3EC4